MAEGVVDELETVDVDQHDRDAATTPGTYRAQGTIDLIHEVASIRQTREGVVITRVFEALLQTLALLDLEGELAIRHLQLASREREGRAGTMQAVHEVVHRESQQPRDHGEQCDGR